MVIAGQGNAEWRCNIDGRHADAHLRGGGHGQCGTQGEPQSAHRPSMNPAGTRLCMFLDLGFTFTGQVHCTRPLYQEDLPDWLHEVLGLPQSGGGRRNNQGAASWDWLLACPMACWIQRRGFVAAQRWLGPGSVIARTPARGCIWRAEAASDRPIHTRRIRCSGRDPPLAVEKRDPSGYPSRSPDTDRP